MTKLIERAATMPRDKSKIIDGIVVAFWTAWLRAEMVPKEITTDDRKAMRAALLWLADNVSDEMIDAAHRGFTHNYNVNDTKADWRVAIAAAIRKAAE